MFLILKDLKIKQQVFVALGLVMLMKLQINCEWSMTQQLVYPS